MDEREIAKNIRKYRRGKSLSLDNLARLTGFTKGYVSKIENSEKAPPFSTLIKIAEALGIDISALITDRSESRQETRLCIVRHNDRKIGAMGASRFAYNYEALAYKKPGKNMEPYLITPSFAEKAVFSHEGEEFMYVLEGIHEFTYGGERYVLNQGDSIYFDSIVPHTGRSLGEKRARVLAVLYSYKRAQQVSFKETHGKH